MNCTAQSCIADGTMCENYYACPEPVKVATITVYPRRQSVVERCKEQHLSWKEILGCILAALWGSVSL